jgi:hypothetical protein
MKGIVSLLAIVVSSWSCAQEGKLVGMLEEYPSGTFHISNEGHPSGSYAAISLTISGKADQLKGNVRKYVELSGDYAFGDKEGDLVFMVESIKVLAEQYYLEGQIVQYKHPDGSMNHIKFAIVTSSGNFFALDHSKVKGDMPMKHVRAYGDFGSAGHKGLMIAFYATKIETVPVKEAKD